VFEKHRSPFYYGFVIAALGFLIQAVFWGIYRSFGLFFNPLLNEFNWTRAEVAGAASMGWLVVGLMNFPAGAAVDRFGPRLTLSICGVFFGLGYLLMSGVHGLWQVYAFYMVMAIGMSAADVVPLSTIARWFTTKRGTVTGMAKVGTGIGMMVTPVFASHLISTHGWRTAYAVLGAVAIIALATMAQFIRRDPSKMGLRAYGEIETAKSVKRPERGIPLREALRTRQFATLCAAYLLVTTVAEVVMMHTVPHAVDMGISTTAAAGIPRGIVRRHHGSKRSGWRHWTSPHRASIRCVRQLPPPLHGSDCHGRPRAIAGSITYKDSLPDRDRETGGESGRWLGVIACERARQC